MTVLYEYTYTGDTVDIMVKLFMLAACFLLFLCIWFYSVKRTWAKAVVAAIIGFVVVVDVMLFIEIPKSATTTRYKVKMEEKVDLNEFLTQYKIIETEGDIIVVEQIQHGE